jgi:hypothetical protein
MPTKAKQKNHATDQKSRSKVVVCAGKHVFQRHLGSGFTVASAISHHASLSKKIAAFKRPDEKVGGWTFLGSAKDQKCEDPTLALATELKEFTSFARGAIKSMMGGKAVKFVLPLTYSASATVSTGIVNTILNISVADSPEWASVAALFDEYRFDRAIGHILPSAPTPTMVLGTSALQINSLFGIGYDPADATSATDPRDIAQLEQHRQFYPRIVPTGAVGTFVGVFGKADNSPLVFNWECAAESIIVNATGVPAPGCWKATTATGYNDGYLKPYFQSGITSGSGSQLIALLGTLYYHIHLRSRT